MQTVACGLEGEGGSDGSVDGEIKDGQNERKYFYHSLGRILRMCYEQKHPIMESPCENFEQTFCALAVAMPFAENTEVQLIPHQ